KGSIRRPTAHGMKKNLRIRTIVIALVTVAALYVMLMPQDRLPKLTDFTSRNQLNANLQNNIHLGLDLKGGIHLVMQVQAEEAVQAHMAQNAESVKKVLPDKGIQLAGDPAV